MVIRNKAFTLLETLIVVSVLAVLIAIIVPRIMGFQDQAKISKAKSELKTIQSALESYAINHDRIYPSTAAITDFLRNTGNAIPQMIDRVLYDPFGDGIEEYQYSVSDDGRSYAVASKGPDGVVGTATVVNAGNVPSIGDDLLVTNGTVTVLDVTGDQNNCGTIGTECAGGKICAAGVCECSGGTTDCNGTCVDMTTDNAHCGACDEVCAGDQTCTTGACACNDVSLTNCSATCTDTDIDDAHCGNCITACAAGLICTGGVCKASVTYDGNSNTGGAVPVDANAYASGASVTVLDNTGTLVRTGYAFSGWNTAANGSGTDRAAASTFAMGSANVTLYAKWTINTYAVTYNANSASSGSVPAAQTKTYDVALTLATNSGTLARTGYTFSGWNTAAGGSGTDYAVSASYTANAAATLYAKWVDVCSGSPVAGTVCADGTVYVSAVLRTTPSDAGTFQWSTEEIVTGVTSSADGETNTATLAALPGTYPAADHCAGLSFGGHEDWYLPAPDQLTLLYNNKVAIGGFADDYFWSSREAWAADVADFLYFGSGFSILVLHKIDTYRVRCIRTP